MSDLRIVTPLKDRILVQMFETGEDRQYKHIIIPEKYRPVARRGVVRAIGPKVYDLKVGDVVILPSSGATHPDKKLGDMILVTMHDVGAILTQ
jgi:co-chaperonin GroES (HSP10)